MSKNHELWCQAATSSYIRPFQGLQLCKVHRVHKIITNDSLLVLCHMRKQNRELSQLRDLGAIWGNLEEFSRQVILVFKHQKSLEKSAVVN